MKNFKHKLTDSDYENLEAENSGFEKFTSKKNRYLKRRRISEFHNDQAEGKEFTYGDLANLQSDGLIDELLNVIKTGKEASVFLGKVNGEFRAVKIYTDIRIRSFRKDDLYRQGRFIGSARVEKAIEQSSRFGLDAHQLLWVGEEFRQMKELHKSGVPVPRPFAISGLTIVMEFIGSTGGEPAPRISDVNLDKYDAENAFRQCVKILKSMFRMGKVHGDFSAFNVLWHNEKVTAIDFPQVVESESNNSFTELLKRDVNSLCSSFRKHGLRIDPGPVFREVLNGR